MFLVKCRCVSGMIWGCNRREAISLSEVWRGVSFRRGLRPDGVDWTWRDFKTIQNLGRRDGLLRHGALRWVAELLARTPMDSKQLSKPSRMLQQSRGTWGGI